MEATKIELRDSNDNSIKVVSPQDYVDLPTLYKSCGIVVSMMTLTSKAITSVISNGMEFSGEEMSNDLMRFLINIGKNSELFRNTPPGDIQFAYAPRIIGGTNYQLYLKSIDTANSLGVDIVQLAFGIVYKGYSCNYARPILINPTKELKESYKYILLILGNIIENLKAGISFKSLHKSVMKFATEQNSILSGHLKKEMGYGLGHNFKNNSVILEPSSVATAQANTIFAINIELEGLTIEGKKYSLFSSDTVLIQSIEPAKLLTFCDKYQTFVIEKK